MHYFIVSVSKQHAQLFEVTGDRILPRGVDGMPTSMADAWKGMERHDQSIQVHPTGDGHVGFHGQGGAKDTEEQEENEYMHKLAKSLHTILHEQQVPVVFAGVTEAYGMFKKYDASGCLLDAYIQGSPDQLDQKALKDKADPIARAHMLHQNEAMLEQFGAVHGTGKTSIDAQEIEAKANEGKIQTLILPEGTEETHQTLAKEVWSHRGHVVIVEPSKMPEGSAMAAILRL